MRESKQMNSPLNRKSHSHCSGFTLLELLVVVAIIAVLASLLSTALNHTKSKAHRITCLSNLRTLQVGWFVYVDENEDQLPMNRTDPSENERVLGRKNSIGSWVVGRPKEDVTAANLAKGSLFPYTKAVSVYRCPADVSTVVGLTTVRRNRSYSMSAYLNGDDAGIDPRVKTRYTEIMSPPPDKVFVFMEEHQDSPWLGSFDVPVKDRFSLASGSWSSTPSDRHNQGCNLSFADGHVEYWKWFWPKEYALSGNPTANKQELRDLRRLQESIPKP